jgi:hypothetical protein
MASVNAQDFQKMIAEVIFRGDLAELPAAFYVGLGTGVLPAKTDTLADIVEVTGPGYERKLLSRNEIDWPTLILVGGNWKVGSITKRWEPDAGDFTAADYAFLTDVLTGTAGRFFVAGTLDEPFLALDGDSWDGTAEWIGRP